MPESPGSNKETKPAANDLQERARQVHETLNRLLREINELLDKTKRLVKEKDPADSERPPKTGKG